MLKALYDYGVQNGLVNVPGFAEKAIYAYIVLSKNGDFIRIESGQNEKHKCPDIGSLANGPDKCNPLAEKAEIILAVEPAKTLKEPSSEKEAKAIQKQMNNLVKKRFFCEMLESSSSDVPEHAACLKALNTPACFAAICEAAKQKKIKSADRISFRVGGQPITDFPAVETWWSAYRMRFAKADAANGTTPCLITGTPTSPLATLPTVNGLQTVGGHSRGEALFCFDKSAFQSYDLKQSANAPVSEEAFTVVKSALENLLNGAPAMYKRDKNSTFTPNAPIFSGMKFVHWYDRKIRYEDDQINSIVGNLDENKAEADGEDQSEKENARDEATELVHSIENDAGQLPELPKEYHILLISGVNGRAMVRKYERGSYQELQKHLQCWYEDLRLCDNFGTGEVRPKKLVTRLIRLLPRQQGEKNIFERMKKELAGLTPSIVMAIINGTPLPDAVASRSLAYIQSQMFDPDENNQMSYMPDGIACQWLKVWVTRKRRMRNEEVQLMPCYQKDFPNAAYHCGAIVAVYAAIQREAMPDVKAGIIQRFYASASRTPFLVLGRLESLSKYHLDKIEQDKPWQKKQVEKLEAYLNEAYSFFKPDEKHGIPTVLNLEDQSYFAIGYRQMVAQLEADRRNTDPKQTKNETNENHDEEDK